MLNSAQVKTRAQEFALTNEITHTNDTLKRYWPTFRTDLASLHDFAKVLKGYHVECKQPAEDWLLDHMNFIEVQAQVVFKELPRTKLHRLPKLRSTGMPRIYGICYDYLDCVDGRYENQSFIDYLVAFQEVSVLNDIECWTLLSAMRVTIIQKLATVMREVRKRHEACHFVKSLVPLKGTNELSHTYIRNLLEQETKGRRLDPVEIVHFVQHISEWEPNTRVIYEWLATHMDSHEFNLEHLVSLEHQLQAELQLVCGNLVRSLHQIERLPWRLTFAKISHIEQLFHSRPNSGYAQLDLESQDVLRRHVVQMSAQLNVPEILVAKTALELSTSFNESPEKANLSPRAANLAFYLMDANGISLLRKELMKVARPRVLPHLTLMKQPSISYFTGMGILFVLLLLLTSRWMLTGTFITPLSWLIALIALVIPVSDWVIALIHEGISKCCRPTPLLRYDFSKKLPNDAATMVVMPVIWSSIEEVDEVIEQLQVHYLGNRQPNIHFGVLADFCDADRDTLPIDETIINHAIERIDELRDQYGQERFFLFHRNRQYNSRDGVHMGWERKRGKLVEFVELLAGKEDTSYTTVHGQKEILPSIRYIFTTDFDTHLPIGVVARLAGTIHFPYNRPILNEDESRVVEGFGLLQPRVGASFESTQKSRFAALWADEPGIDPYAFAVSNVYQDFFGHAIFVGKGIFDVEAFRKTLADRIPEHAVLSHDLLEGGFLRAGLTSDIEVVESFPATFHAYERRAHRWIRGDWQLIKWLGKKCEDRHGEKKEISLCSLTRWQIIDNLRRSLRAPILVLLLLLGFFALPVRGTAWATIVLLTIFFPFFVALVSGLLNGKVSKSLGTIFLQCALQFITLPFTAMLSIDAIVRTLYRLFVSHKNLLEWVPSAQTDREDTKKRVFLFESSGYLLVVVFALISFFSDGAIDRTVGLAIALLWLIARPTIQYYNQVPVNEEQKWINGAKPQLEKLAKQIWLFYEKYVTEVDSWLPPDNVQYHPDEVIAHRTSPTNIGLYLSCVVAARDLQFIDTSTALTRIEATVETIKRMEKWNGHLLNWYDTCTASPLFPRYVSTVDSGNFVAYLMVMEQSILEWSKQEDEPSARMTALLSDLRQLIEATDFTSLYNANERLFSLGYHLDHDRKDTILYDLLASEARQASFVAIALGQIPASHWFALGRTMTISGRHKTLLSWSGTMFEYLMPKLIMRTYPNTIWDSTYRGVVKRQQEYAAAFQLPFGISESGYYAYDYQYNYQYRAFGVPGLGLDQGLENNLVLAPYATIMALPYAGEAGLQALRQFEEFEAHGEYGYYEAVDFTTPRLTSGQRYQVVQSYMAHHQGMAMLTLVNILTDDLMVQRFHADPRIASADLLLQERIPEKVALLEEPLGLHEKFDSFDEYFDTIERSYTKTHTVQEVNVLSNSRMTSVATNTGTGFIAWKGHSVTKWQEDPVMDQSGMVVYLHDVQSDETWNPTSFPAFALDESQAVFRLDKTTFQGASHGISSTLEITVPPDLDAEVRRLTLTNQGKDERVLDVTTFLELALASPSAFSAHPAFNKLFIETSYDETEQCLFAKRRAREKEEDDIWAVHSVFVDGASDSLFEFETDRAKFIGRGYSLKEPKAVKSKLSGLLGSVVDPAFIMRRRVRIPAQESVEVYMVTGVADSREKAVGIVQQLRESSQIAHSFHLALVRSQIDLRHLHLTPKQATAAQVLASRLLYTQVLSDIRKQSMKHNQLGQPSLWSHGISGDVPIVSVKITNEADLPFVVLLAQQHQYLVKLGLDIDLVVLDETVGGYQDQLATRFRDQLAGRGLGYLNRIILLKATQLDEQIHILLRTVSRIWLRANGPSLSAQLRAYENPSRSAKMPKQAGMARKTQSLVKRPVNASELEFYNGWGGFTDDGQSYEIHVNQGSFLPRPWSNVISNQEFGTLITDAGTGYSWWRNSRECKITPWTNDPVLDQAGECIYLQDLDTDEVWSATPKPAGSQHNYKVTHGKGFSRFEQLHGDITHTMETVVPMSDTLKMMELRIRNKSATNKRMTVTYYAEWVLGVTREAQTPYIVTEWDEEHQTLLARNAFQDRFRDAVSFLHFIVPDSAQPQASWTGDREEFIGQGGQMEYPLGLREKGLSKRTGSFAQSCGGVQMEIQLAANEEIPIYILFGCESSKEGVFSLIRKYREPNMFETMRSDVASYWQKLLGQVQIRTPNRAMDIMMNGWLLYQTVACRLWARTGFFQAGGAYGYRDQLQDSLSLLHTDPSATRKQILINAAHQYQEGDVQHWWHEETHKGIRTKFSDDLLWLPYTVSRYIEQTGDYGILYEEVPFLISSPLTEEELERYEDTVVSNEVGSLLEHCLRAIGRGLNFGEHGLPLMGIGDWNDGMSRIGAKGRGESVWLGWFIVDILKRFIRFEKDVIPADLVESYRKHAQQLEDNLNQHAWDGNWFRRAFTDAGTWIGSTESQECKIDAIAQSWSIISDGTSPSRKHQAMTSFERELVDRDLGLIRLLTKPFNETKPTPGYIQGYPPGIRENGGQYTHGVIWSIVAWAMLQRGDKAFDHFSLINPINHTLTNKDIHTYENEPYVMSADVYTAHPHYGRGGWSWYTGASGWLYQAGLEYILGIKVEQNRLSVNPCVPDDWDSFEVKYVFGHSTYTIEVINQREEQARWIVDGVDQGTLSYFNLVDDGQGHDIKVYYQPQLAVSSAR